MADPKQPTAWTVRLSGDSEWPGNPSLVLNCARECTIPLRADGPKEANGAKAWGWNGSMDAASVSVTPSIDCTECKWHKTITNGVAA